MIRFLENDQELKRGIIAIVGYVLFLTGMISLILAMIGLTFQPFAFLDALGNPLSLVIKFIFVIAGLIILYVARVNRE